MQGPRITKIQVYNLQITPYITYLTENLMNILLNF